MRFEKSATYFDSSLAIKRIRALLPNVRLIIILIEPGQRAHSRYQVSECSYDRDNEAASQTLGKPCRGRGGRS